MAITCRQNGDKCKKRRKNREKIAIKIATKWRKKGDKMAIKWR